MSRYFQNARPVKAHLLRGGGVGGEVQDLRNDVGGALDAVQVDIDALEAGGGILVYFSFDGNAPPGPAGLIGRHGICHTTGGVYGRGVLYQMSATGLVQVSSKVGQLIATTTAILVGLPMDADSIYALTDTTPNPILWVKKGGSSGSSGILAVTTVERLALSATDGQVVYDTDLRKLMVYQNDIDWPVWAEV